MNTIPNKNALSKTQQRRLRYEKNTLNKPCTVRANPDRHSKIKRFAKSGHCDKCQKHFKLFIKAKNQFQQQIDIPKWSDEFTPRAAAISVYTVCFIITIYIVNDIVKNISF
ncbi:MAG: hypothetical protein ACMZ63_06375 [Methylotenera sp.]